MLIAKLKNAFTFDGEVKLKSILINWLLMSEEKILEEIKNELREIKEEVEGLRKEMRGLRKGIEELIEVVKPLQYFYGGMWGALLWTITVIILLDVMFGVYSKTMTWIGGFGQGLSIGLIGMILEAILFILFIKNITSSVRGNKDNEEEESE